MQTGPSSESENDAQFSQRLADAFDHLNDAQKEAIRSAMDKEGLEGGLKGGLARLVGMNTPSLLSDMLAGRAKGRRYQDDLAKWLGVQVAWLNGDDSRAPDWAILPLQAWERWVKQLRIAWQAWYMDQNSNPGQSTVLALRLSSDSRYAHKGMSGEQRQLLAAKLDLEPDDPLIESVGKGEWQTIPFDMVIAIAEELGARIPADLNHLRRGHAVAMEAAEQQEMVVHRFRDQILRYGLPPHLFRLCRLALVTLKQQRTYLQKNTTDVDDAIELIWRQQFQLQQRSLEEIPEAFSSETGRNNWTALDKIMKRYQEDNEEVEERYESRFGTERSPLRRE